MTVSGLRAIGTRIRSLEVAVLVVVGPSRTLIDQTVAVLIQPVGELRRPLADSRVAVVAVSATSGLPIAVGIVQAGQAALTIVAEQKHHRQLFLTQSKGQIPTYRRGRNRREAKRKLSRVARLDRNRCLIDKYKSRVGHRSAGDLQHERAGVFDGDHTICRAPGGDGTEVDGQGNTDTSGSTAFARTSTRRGESFPVCVRSTVAR